MDRYLHSEIDFCRPDGYIRDNMGVVDALRLMWSASGDTTTNCKNALVFSSVFGFLENIKFSNNCTRSSQK